jgi:surface polysaccharide O-acyltransferase-like enzyme
MSKLYWITNLRVFATIMVVFIHSSGGALLHYKDIPDSWWWIDNIINNLGRFAVPVFFMISGGLLLGREIDVIPFLQKRLLRVWIPFTIWVVIYVLYNNFFERPFQPFKQAFTEYLSMSSRLYGHFWFIYTLLGLYLFTPIINYFIKTANALEINYFLIVCFISSCVYLFIKRWFGVEVKFDLQNFGGYTGYFVGGYVLKNTTFKLNKWYYISGFLLTYFILLMGNYWLVLPNGKANLYFQSYLSPNVILMSICIFMFFKDYLNQEFLPTLMQRLDATSFGIYLSHLLVIKILSHKFSINWAWHHPLIGITAQAGLTLIITFILITVISKIPKSQWITG